MNKLKPFSTVLFSLLLPFLGCSQQNIADYTGKWIGKIADKNALKLNISIKKTTIENAVFKLSSNNTEILNKKFKFNNQINLTFKSGIVFNTIVNYKKSEINGFIQSNGYYYPIRLKKDGELYKGQWNVSAFQHLQPESLYLTFKEGNSPNDLYKAYPILGSLWCNNFKKQGDSISFTDYFSGLNFKGVLKISEIILKVYFNKNELTQISYKRVNEEKIKTATQYQKNDDGWDFIEKKLSLVKMEEDIKNDTLTGTESVLVAQNCKIIYENYFEGFNVNTPHDMRSASKSVSSTIIGIAIDEGIIDNVDEPLYKFIPKEYQYTVDSLKSKIKLHNLLTMSSGINVSENTYQQSKNWLKTVLEPSLGQKPKPVTRYKSADPYLTGIFLSERLEIPLEIYIQKRLFTPLGIHNYVINTDDTKQRPYFAGGLHLTPRDMLKFGQLYLNKGIWKGKRIISEEWINNSFKSHTRLENVSDKNEYGYLWWHNTFIVNGKQFKSIEARGAGGQYIFLFPVLNIVAIITSGNYRNKKTRQPEKILEKYILPKIID